MTVKMYQIINLDGSDYESESDGSPLFFYDAGEAVRYAYINKKAVLEWSMTAGWQDDRNNGRWEKY